MTAATSPDDADRLFRMAATLGFDPAAIARSVPEDRWAAAAARCGDCTDLEGCDCWVELCGARAAKGVPPSFCLNALFLSELARI